MNARSASLRYYYEHRELILEKGKARRDRNRELGIPKKRNIEKEKLYNAIYYVRVTKRKKQGLEPLTMENWEENWESYLKS